MIPKNVPAKPRNKGAETVLLMLFTIVSICLSVISFIILKSAALPLLLIKYEFVDVAVFENSFET